MNNEITVKELKKLLSFEDDDAIIIFRKENKLFDSTSEYNEFELSRCHEDRKLLIFNLDFRDNDQ